MSREKIVLMSRPKHVRIVKIRGKMKTYRPYFGQNCRLLTTPKTIRFIPDIQYFRKCGIFIGIKIVIHKKA